VLIFSFSFRRIAPSFPSLTLRLDYAHRQHRQPDSYAIAQAGQDSTGGVECQQIGIVPDHRKRFAVR
jgi:hypothetical protein